VRITFRFGNDSVPDLNQGKGHPVKTAKRVYNV